MLHCGECHVMDMAVIPHRVLNDYNCKPSKVCKSAKHYLDNMYKIPLITINMFNTKLIKQKSKKITKKLLKTEIILKRLSIIKQYMNSCRNFKNFIETDIKIKEYKHFIKNAGLLSLNDVVNIILFDTHLKLDKLCKILIRHITHDCQMCRLRGHFCEICNDQYVIYPFQFEIVYQCTKCKGCFHKKCFNKLTNNNNAINSDNNNSTDNNCPKCKRRKSKIIQQKLINIT